MKIALGIYNVPVFLVKSIFFNNLIASLLLILLVIQEPLIFKIEISLSLLDIINKALHLLHTYG